MVVVVVVVVVAVVVVVVVGGCFKGGSRLPSWLTYSFPSLPPLLPFLGLTELEIRKRESAMQLFRIDSVSTKYFSVFNKLFFFFIFFFFFFFFFFS